MNARNAAKIREGIYIGRQIAAHTLTEGPVAVTTRALYGHPALRDPLVEQAKYRAMTATLSRSRTA